MIACIVGALVGSGCSEVVGDGQCGEDSDCAAGETCLVDLTRGTTYCSALCALDSDCPLHQSCRLSENDDVELRVCVDTVRTCGDVEICNGLDDDCDGVVDGPDCVIQDGCLNDAQCGGWVCQAPENQPLALCAPGVEGGKSDFARCTEDSECLNGVCETGFCSEFCRADNTRGCPTVFVGGEPYETICARAVGDASRPAHNKCQVACTTTRSCPDGLTCVWRTVYQSGADHQWVCAFPDPTRKALGEACSNNRPDEGDAECQSGLCYGRTCTRSCGGPGSDCSDVGAAFVCRDIDLFYSDPDTNIQLTFGAFVCVEE